MILVSRRESPGRAPRSGILVGSHHLIINGQLHRTAPRALSHEPQGRSQVAMDRSRYNMLINEDPPTVGEGLFVQEDRFLQVPGFPVGARRFSRRRAQVAEVGVPVTV